MTPRPPSDRSRALATAPNPLKRGFPGVTFDGKSPCHDDHHLTSERDKKTRSGIASSRSAARIARLPPHARHAIGLPAGEQRT